MIAIVAGENPVRPLVCLLRELAFRAEMLYLSSANLLAVGAEAEKYLTEVTAKDIPETTWLFANIVAMVINPLGGMA